MSESSAVEGCVPWWPASVAAYAESPAQARAAWAYVVVEEVAGAVAELVRWPWPLADQLGHLVWPLADQAQAMTATVTIPVLRRFMYEPSGLQRTPRSGDAFAAEIGGSGWSDPDSDDEEPVMDLRLLFPAMVLDISADARDAAKLAYQSASAAVYDGSDAEELLEKSSQTREARTAEPVPLTIAPPHESNGGAS